MRKIILILALFVIVFSSCNDWLDVRPETEQEEKDQFSSYKGFRDALTGCYMSLNNSNIYGEKLTMSHIESLANLWQTSSSASGDRLVDYYLSIHDYDSDEAREAMQSIWSSMFNVIVQANMVIKYAQKNKNVFENEATRSVILGEAYAIRAYCQLDILRLFGQLPKDATIQVDLPYSETTAFDEYPTSYPFVDYIEKLESDLNQAEMLLKNNDPIFYYTFNQLNSPSNKLFDDNYMYYRQSRMNYWAVKALQARFYLYLGKKDKAYDAAMAIINGKGVDEKPIMTLSGTSDIVEHNYKACPSECLFYLSKQNVKSVANILIGGNDIQARSGAYLYITTAQLTQLFAGEQTDNHNRYRYVWNRTLKDVSNRSCAAILKYYFPDETEDQMLYYQIIPMLRMSEVYLIAIECTENLVEANQLYADYMLSHDVVVNENTFASLNDIQNMIVNEYRREFYAEGQMFYMYKRTNTKNILWNSEEMTEEDYVLWKCISSDFNA